MVLVEHPDGRQERFRFVHQRADYERLVSFLKACPGPCRIALEPTADYHRTIAYRLVSEGFDLVLMSSVAGARLREAVFNSWDKNDPKDAQVIMRLRKARTAITAKVARVVYALIKHGQPYRQRFDVDLPNGSISLRRAVEAFGTS